MLFTQQYYHTCDRNQPKLPISHIYGVCRNHRSKHIHRSPQIVFTPITRKHTGLHLFFQLCNHFISLTAPHLSPDDCG